MSIATKVTQADPQRQWFTVEDDGKGAWRYHRTERAAQPGAAVHVAWENTPGNIPSRPVLLRADAPGLPEKAVVTVDDVPPPGPGGLLTSQAFSTMTVEFDRA